MTTATTKPKSSRTKSDTDYVEGVGRRKTAIARVRATPGAKSSYTVNDMPSVRLGSVVGTTFMKIWEFPLR